MEPTNFAARAWGILSSKRLTSFCLATLLAMFLASEAARAWLTWSGALGDAKLGQWLHTWVIADSAAAPGFILVLGVLVLNFLAATAAALQSTQAGAAALLKSGIESRLSSDAFEALARRWFRRHMGRGALASQCEDGSHVLSVRRGRASFWLKGMAHWAVMGALVGAILMMTRGYQVKTIVEEGSRVRGVERIRGPLPPSWKPLRLEKGSIASEPYFETDFEIERVPTEASLSVGSSRFHLYRDGELCATLSLSAGRPAEFEGMWFHLLRYVPGSTQSVSLTVTDRASGVSRSFASLGNGQAVDLEDFGFRVTEIRPETEDAGAAIEVEYREGVHPAQRFWIFSEFPGYDFAHRKKSAQHFTLQSVRDRTAAEIAIGREPGAPLLWGGLLLAAVLFWLGLSWPEERFRLRWNQEAGGLLNVEVLGWSARPQVFRDRFRRLTQLLERQVAEQEHQIGGDDAGARA